MPVVLSKIDKKKITLWTSRKLVFRVNGTICDIQQYTKCEKPKYTVKIMEYLDRMERTSINRPSVDTKAVCIHLMGQLRYVWRTDVLTEDEFNARKQEDKQAVKKVFSKERKRTMD